MTIEELEDKSLDLIANIKNEEAHWDDITKLSIQFAIEFLEDLNQIWVGDSKMIHVNEVQDKIQELKKYLNEKV